MFARTLRNFGQKKWYPDKIPLDFRKDVKPSVMPEEVMEACKPFVDDYGEILDRPIFQDIDFKVIEYDTELKKYQISDQKAPLIFDDPTIIVSIIGAFVPECTQDVVYQWALAAEAFKERFSVSKVIIVGPNDPYVMLKFAQKLDYEEHVSYIADWNGKLAEITESLSEFEFELGRRNHRYLGFALDGALKVVSFCEYSELFYTSAINPEQLWYTFKLSKKIPLYFN